MTTEYFLFHLEFKGEGELTSNPHIGLVPNGNIAKTRLASPSPTLLTFTNEDTLAKGTKEHLRLGTDDLGSFHYSAGKVED